MTSGSASLAPGVANAPAGGAGDGLWSPQRRTLTLGLLLTITLVAFEALAVTNILPIVERNLGDIDLYGWVFSAFFLGSLIGIAVSGGLIDRVGLLRPFVLGLGLFGLGLLIGGLAPSMPVLIVGRFIQGLGGGTIPPTAYVAIGRSMPESMRPAMFATLATAWVVPGIIAPAISATVAENLGWQWVFFGLIPIAVLAGLMTLPALRRVPSAVSAAGAAPPTAGLSARRIQLALAITAGAGLVLAGLGSDSILVLVALVGAGLLVGLPAFARLAPPGTLRLARGVPAAILLRGALTFLFFAPDVYLPLAFQSWRGVSAFVTGIGLSAASLTWTAAAWVQARYIGRFGPAAFVRLGFAIVIVGTAATTAVLWPEVPIWFGLVAWGVAAIGMGLSYSALSIIVLRDATPGEEGGPTSALQLSDVLGSALGTGFGGAILAAATRAGEPLWVGLAGAFGLAIVVGVLGLLGSARLFGSKPSGAGAAEVPSVSPSDVLMGEFPEI